MATHYVRTHTRRATDTEPGRISVTTSEGQQGVVPIEHGAEDIHVAALLRVLGLDPLTTRVERTGDTPSGGQYVVTVP